MKKIVICLVLALMLVPVVSAAHSTYFTIPGQILDDYGNPEPGINVSATISTASSCSTSLIFNDSATDLTDLYGAYYIPVTASMNYNQDYYLCLYENGTETVGPVVFRAGQGQIDEDDVSFDDLEVGSLDVDDYLDVDGDVYLRSTVNITEWLWVGGDINSSGIFYGDGSGLTNLNLTGNITFDGDIIPSLNDTYDIGNSTHIWQNIWGDDIYAEHALLTDLGYFGNSINIGATLSGNKAVNIFSFPSGPRTAWIDWNGDINTTGVYYGNGSGLTDLPISSYFNRSGTALFPANAGDYIGLNGSAAEAVCFDYDVCNSYIYYDSSEMLIAAESTGDDIYISGDGSVSLDGGSGAIIIEGPALDMNGYAIWGGNSTEGQIIYDLDKDQWNVSDGMAINSSFLCSNAGLCNIGDGASWFNSLFLDNRIYFDGVSVSKYLQWNTTDANFEFSDNLKVNGKLNVTGVGYVNGTHQICTAENGLCGGAGGNVTINQTDTYYFDAYDNAGGTAVTGTWTDVPLDTERIESGFTHTGSSASVQVDNDGTYVVTGSVTTEITSAGTTRQGQQMRLMLDTGSGFAEVDGTYAYSYARSSAGHEHSTSTVTAILELDSGDDLKLQAIELDTAPTTTLAADGSRLTIYNVDGSNVTAEGGGGGGGSSVTNVISKYAYNFVNSAGTFNGSACNAAGFGTLGGQYAFSTYDQTTCEASFVNIVVPKNIDLTQNGTVNLHWTQGGVGSGNVLWKVATVRNQIGNAYNLATPVWQNTTAASGGTAWRRNSDASFTIDTTGWTIGDDISIIFVRDAGNAADTLTTDADINQVEFVYTTVS